MYCMPPEGVSLSPSDKLLSRDEIVRLAGLFSQLGVEKIRLTGGEPLVYKEIVELSCAIRKTCPGVKQLTMTTNGITLPRKIHALKEAGVTGFNISLDTLDEAKFSYITRRPGLSKVLDSIAMAEVLGYSPVKVNCVVMKGVNEDEVGAFAMMTKDRPLEVRFIEYMPFDDNQWARSKMFTFMETFDAVEKQTGKKLKPAGNSETAKLFAIDGHVGKVGFITSMTTHFCGTCNRLRLTADGNLKVCLFGEDETSLRDPMRGGASDGELEAIIRAAVQKKFFSHGGKGSPEAIAASSNRPMIKIGG
jgi:cyclic pyranopterin phosphate synthase